MRRILFPTLLLFPGFALAAAPTAAQILARAKAASGASAWDHIRSIRMEGTVEADELTLCRFRAMLRDYAPGILKFQQYLAFIRERRTIYA